MSAGTCTNYHGRTAKHVINHVNVSLQIMHANYLTPRLTAQTKLSAAVIEKNYFCVTHCSTAGFSEVIKEFRHS